MRRPRQKPCITFTCHDAKSVKQPDVFPETESSFTLYAPQNVSGAPTVQQISSKVSLSLPAGFFGFLQSHPFALGKGLLLVATNPITTFTEGAIRLSIVTVAGHGGPTNAVRIIKGQPLAILTILRAPVINGYFNGFDSPEDAE